MKNTIETKEKNWILRSVDSPENNAAAEQIARLLGINPIVAKLLFNRGYTDAASAKAFIYMETETLPSPFEMRDIEKGIERIHKAVDSGEKIVVYGDYDVDGVTSVCTLYLYLKSVGANVDYYIPNRAGEGYGVSLNAIEALKAQGATLIITVDTGVTAIEEVAASSNLGVDFIVTDHHECREALPPAVAVINPHRLDCKYPFKELAGVGVVFKLICAYEERIMGKSRRVATENIFSRYADLVAIGTIADVMPIKNENRIIVKYGLSMIDNTERAGLAALIEASSGRGDQRYDKKRKKSKITSSYIGYTLAPRINAAGRIKTASMAVELFLSPTRESAMPIAEDLCRTNKERQAEENKIMQEAYEKIENYDLANNPVIVLDANHWHHGVIGIVASRITEKYCRPTILVSFEGNESSVETPDDIGKGSGRSIKGMNLVDGLYHCSDRLVKFGGHELAAGLSVTRGCLEDFRAKINEYARENLKDEDMVTTVEADCLINFEDVNVSLAKSFQMLEPYGVSNPVPVFIMRGALLTEISGVSDNKHTKLTIGNGRHTLPAMYFSNSPSSLGLYVGDRVDILFNIDINEWGGRESVQLIIRDIKPSRQQRLREDGERARFEEIRCGAGFDAEENVLPTRDDVAAVYRLMLTSLRSGVDVLSHRDILAKLASPQSQINIGYIKLKFIIMIFKELNIVAIDEPASEVYKFMIHYSSTKTELEKSNILRKLRSQMGRL